LALYDGLGKLVGKTRIWFQDASFLRIEDAAARKDGNIAVVGWTVTSSGSHAAFLADVSVTRSNGRIIQTSPFEGRAVDFGPDGTIWVLGLEVGSGRRTESAPDHYMVQHFGDGDILLDQHLLRSDVHCELATQINGVPRVVASGDRIGLFAPFCRMWLELSPAGEVLGQWKWDPRAPVSNGVEKVGAPAWQVCGQWRLLLEMNCMGGVIGRNRIAYFASTVSQVTGLQWKLLLPRMREHHSSG